MQCLISDLSVGPNLNLKCEWLCQTAEPNGNMAPQSALHHHVFLGHMVNPYPTAFPYGNGMVLHFYQQQESSTTKTVHKVINKGLKTYV